MNHKRKSSRQGVVLIYSIFMLMLMLVFISYAVDYGRMELIKTEAQQMADATARGALQTYLVSRANSADSTSFEPTTSWLKTNIVAKNSFSGFGTPTTTVTWGYWNTSTNTFTTSAGFVRNAASFPTRCLAVQVVVKGSPTNSNAVPLMFSVPNSAGGLSNKTCNFSATAIAMLPNVISSANAPVASTGDPWLAGMAAGAGASDDDTAPTNSPAAISVVPGSTVTFTNVTGTVTHMAVTPTDGPTGVNPGDPYWHHRDGASPVSQGAGDENGIGDLVAPIDSMIGVFLNGSAPNASGNSSIANPSTRTAAADVQNSVTNDIKLQQPFYIGDGNDDNGAIKTFIVPSGATRMYLGIMDGFEWMNNHGSFSVGNISVQPPIQIVQ